MPMPNLQDKGLAWAVAISSTFVMFISQSTFTSYGSIMSSVNMDLTTRTWIINVMYALYFATALVVGPLIRMSTHRKVALIGCLLVTCGFLLSGTTLESPYWLFLTLSSFVGIGLGLAVHSTFLLVTDHFACYRGLAVGIGLLSAGAGNLLSPLIYDWIDGPKDRFNLRALAAAMCFMSISFYLPPPFPSSSSSMSPMSKFNSKSSQSITSMSSAESKKIRGKQGQQHQTNVNQNRMGSSGSREKIPLVGADRQRRPSQFMLSIEKTLLPPLEETDAEEESESQTPQSQSSSVLTISSINNNNNNNNSNNQSQNDSAPMDLTINLKNNCDNSSTQEEDDEESLSTSSSDLAIKIECNVEEQKPQPDLILSSSSTSVKSQNFDDDHNHSERAPKNKRSESVIHIPEKSDTHHFHNSYQPYRKLSLPETSTITTTTTTNRENNHVAAKKREQYEEYRRKIMEMNEKEMGKNDAPSTRGNSRSNSIVSLVTIKSKNSNTGAGDGNHGNKQYLRLKHFIQSHLRYFKMIHFSLLKNLKFLNMTIGTLFIILLPNFPLILYAHVLNISQHQNGRSFRSLGEQTTAKIETENNNNNTNNNILQWESPDSIEMRTNEGDFVLLIIFTLDLVSRFIFSYISDFTFFNRRLGFLCGVFLSTLVIVGIGFINDIYLIYVLSVTYGVFLGLMVVTESLMFAEIFGIDRLASAYGFIGLFKMILILILSSSTALLSPTSSFTYNVFPLFHPKANNTIDQLDLFSFPGGNSSIISTNFSTENVTKHHQYLFGMIAIPGILCTVTWCMELLWTYKLANKFQKKKPSNTISSKDTNTNSSPNV